MLSLNGCTLYLRRAFLIQAYLHVRQANHVWLVGQAPLVMHPVDGCTLLPERLYVMEPLVMEKAGKEGGGKLEGSD